MGLLALGGVQGMAAATDSDGQASAPGVSDMGKPGEADPSAYRDWPSMRDAPSAVAPDAPAAGPNTMDLSSDFSM